MRLLFIPVFLILLAISFTNCGSSSSGPGNFCDTTCNNDSILFTSDQSPQAFVRISQANCNPDSINWGHVYLPTSKIMSFNTLVEKNVKINKSALRIVFKDTSYSWLIFNECINGQGFIVKLTYGKTGSIFRKNSAINSYDKKYVIPDNLVAWSDRGNIIVEEIQTGKQDVLTFGKRTEMDYNKMHETLDSVNITGQRIWAKVKVDGEWKEFSKDLKFQ